MTAQCIVSEIKQLFEQHGGSAYFGENVTQYSHAAQAALLADQQKLGLDIEVAAFLHDIGHLLPPESLDQLPTLYGHEDHDVLAGNWLKERGFSNKVQAVVRDHVKAKRYLCSKDLTYYQKLSDASKETLKLQGGPLSWEACRAFEQAPYFEETIRVRKIDDAAKQTTVVGLPPLNYFLDLCEHYLTPSNITY